jgi:uncharacterized membrane protein YfcA
MSASSLALVLITSVAAIVNGALGYGFSSITVPLALLFLSNRVLNPALVLMEVPLNAYVLWVNRSALAGVWRRVVPVVIGLGPGVIVGTLILAVANAAWLKLATYGVLMPLILIQAAGYRRPIRAEQSAGLIFGSAVGVLYAVTTISGPPLAVALNNQGFSKSEFRAALGCVRLVESTLTMIAYVVAGLFVRDSIRLVPVIVPSVLIGVPLGAVIVQHVRSESFRRVCMSFDAWVVSFGISTLLGDLHLMERHAAFVVMVGVVAFDAWLLYRFFGGRRAGAVGRVASAARQP